MQYAPSSVEIYPAHEGAPVSPDFHLRVNGREVPVFATPSRYGEDFGFAYFTMSPGLAVHVEVTFAFGPVNSVRAIPSKYGIDVSFDRATASFDILEPDTYVTLIVNGDYTYRPLHIFANGPDKWDVNPDDVSVRYFGPGYHEFPLDEIIELGSGETLYLAPGAWVNSPVRVMSGSSDVRICGQGVLATDQLYTARVQRVDGIQVDPDCERITIEGIIVNKRVTGWCGILIKSRDISIRNFKVVTGCIWSTDGMNPTNCQNVTYENCFIRCGDDTIAVKGFTKRGVRNEPDVDPALSPPNESIYVDNCILWSDNNNAIVLGQETKAAYYRDIHFRNCDILYVNDASDRQGVLSLICLDGTNYSDISFEDIRVGKMRRNLINMFFTEEIFDIPGSQRWSGSMHGVRFARVSVEDGSESRIRILGWNETNRITDTVLEDITVAGDPVVTAEDPRIVANEFAMPIHVVHGGDTKGAER